MNFLITFQSELLKTKRTYAWWLCVAVAAVAPALSSVDYYDQENMAAKIKDGNPWTLYLEHANQLFNILLVPMLVIFMGTMLAQIEFRNNTWKQVLTSPQPKIVIYLTRFATILLMVLLTLFSFDIFLLGVAVFTDLVKPGYSFMQHPLDITILLKSNFKSFVGVLGVAAIHFWLGLRMKNFIAPIAIGIVGWFVTATLTFEVRMPHADLIPYTYTIFPIFPKYDHKLTQILLSSVGYCLLFLAIGFYDFKTRRKD